MKSLQIEMGRMVWVRETSWVGLHEIQGSDAELRVVYWELIQLDVDSLTVLQTTLFTLSYINAYNYNFLFDLQARSRSVQGSRPYTSENGERIEKRGNGFYILTLGIKKKLGFFTVRTDICHSISRREV
jgi:hypothetical protein